MTKIQTKRSFHREICPKDANRMANSVDTDQTAPLGGLHRLSADDTGRERVMSRVMRKPTFCICENKDADQLRGNREADQRLCFRFTDSTVPLLFKPEISGL